MAVEAHHSQPARGYMRTSYLLIALVVLSFASLFVGVVNLSPADLFGLTTKKAQVLMISRIPRLVSILLSGMSMGLCGLIMQQLSQNRFVSPTTAGTLDEIGRASCRGRVWSSEATDLGIKGDWSWEHQDNR